MENEMIKEDIVGWITADDAWPPFKRDISGWLTFDTFGWIDGIHKFNKGE